MFLRKAFLIRIISQSYFLYFLPLYAFPLYLVCVSVSVGESLFVTP